MSTVITKTTIQAVVDEYERENPGADGWKMPTEEFARRMMVEIKEPATITIEANRLWRMWFMDLADRREEAIKARAIEYANEPPSNIPDIDDSDKINRMRQPYTKWQYDPEEDQ